MSPSRSCFPVLADRQEFQSLNRLLSESRPPRSPQPSARKQLFPDFPAKKRAVASTDSPNRPAAQALLGTYDKPTED